MKKYKIILPFLMTALMLTAAYGQKNTENHLTRVISGVLIKNDFVGNIIAIQTDNGHQMSFSVPSNIIITRDTRDIGLMDVKVGHPVTIQYDASSPGKNFAQSIVDNKSTNSGDVN